MDQPPQTKRPATLLPKKPQVSSASSDSGNSIQKKAPASPWMALFRDWPAEIPQRGIVVTRLNETSPFKGFMLREEFILLERMTPDSLGGRFLLICPEEIACVKLTDPLKQPAFEAAGFQGKISG